MRPAGAADDRDRPFGRPQHFLQFGHLGLPRPDRGGLDAQSVGDGGEIGQHVLGQRDHDRAGPTLHRDVPGALDDLGDLRGLAGSPSTHFAVEPKKAR